MVAVEVGLLAPTDPVDELSDRTNPLGRKYELFEGGYAGLTAALCTQQPSFCNRGSLRGARPRPARSRADAVSPRLTRRLRSRSLAI
jgi:hypothetical protein